MTGLLPLLQAFYRDKLTELLRHQAGARLVRRYDPNNAYQNIIGREETQLTWLRSAIADLGGRVEDEASEPDRSAAGAGDAAEAAVLAEDSRAAQAFVDAWRPRIEALSSDRHRRMLDVVLGETLEHKRFFDQALAGDADLLGRRSESVGPRVGVVRPTRWIE